MPLNINIIYKQPRDLRETAWDNVTFETLFDINFSNYSNENITEEQFEQHRVYTLKHFRKHIQEINLMKQLANDRIAAKSIYGIHLSIIGIMKEYLFKMVIVQHLCIY